MPCLEPYKRWEQKIKLNQIKRNALEEDKRRQLFSLHTWTFVIFELKKINIREVWTYELQDPFWLKKHKARSKLQDSTWWAEKAKNDVSREDWIFSGVKLLAWGLKEMWKWLQ